MSDLSHLSDDEVLRALNGGDPASTGVGGMSDADLMAALKPAEPARPAASSLPMFAQEGLGAQAADVGKGAGIGAVKGAAGLAGLPGYLGQLYDQGTRGLIGLGGRGLEKLGAIDPGKTDKFLADVERLNQEWQSPAERRGDVNYVAGLPLPTVKGINDVVQSAAGPYYEPKTKLGRYAETVGEFAPGAALMPGALVANSIRYGIAPAIASEAAGQATEGTKYEPYARAAAGLGTAGLAAWQAAPAYGERLVARSAGNADAAQFRSAENLMRDAQAQGITLTTAEAIQAATNGATRLSDVQRIVESTPEGAARMNPVMAQRPAQVDSAARAAFNEISPATSSPSALAGAVNEGATQAIAATPEGRRLADALWQAGPRTTPEQAGAVIQPELKAIYDRREGMRAALADQDYTAARNAPAEIPLDGGFGFRDVTSHSLPAPVYPYTRGTNGQIRPMTSDEIAAAELRSPMPVYPTVRGEGGQMRRMTGEEIAGETAKRSADLESARAAQRAQLNTTERMPVIGLEPTRYGQVNANSVLQHIDTALETAKGAVKQGLSAAKSALYTPSGELDTSVAGLHASRTALTDLISQAKMAGAPSTVRELEGALGTLDQALEAVPAYGQARRAFKAASAPVAAFEEGRPLGAAVERNQYSGRFVMPSEAVPPSIERNGASAARDFNAVAPSGPAQDSYRNYLTTRILDAATDARGNVSSDSLRLAVRDNADVLRQFPEVADRISRVVAAREGMAPVERSLLGQIEQAPTVQSIADRLMPKNPLVGSENEVADAIRQLRQTAPADTRGVVRQGVEMPFNATRVDTLGRPDQFGGARYARDMQGNPQRAANVSAAVEGAAGTDASRKYTNLLDALRATGWRARQGSLTAFNTQALEDLSGGGVQSAVQALMKPMQRVKDTAARLQLGRQSERLADLLLSGPDGVRRVEELALGRQGAGNRGLARALLTYGSSANAGR